MHSHERSHFFRTLQGFEWMELFMLEHLRKRIEYCRKIGDVTLNGLVFHCVPRLRVYLLPLRLFSAAMRKTSTSKPAHSLVELPLYRCLGAKMSRATAKSTAAWLPEDLNVLLRKANSKR